MQHLAQHGPKLLYLLRVLGGFVWQFYPIVRVLPNAQDKDGLAVDAPALRSREDGVQEVARVEKGDIGGCHAIYPQHTWNAVSTCNKRQLLIHSPAANVRSVAVRQGIGSDVSSLLFARGRREGEGRLVWFGAVNETILVELQTNRVSIPSALGAEADAGAGRGLLATRAGRVKERRLGFAGTEVARSGGVESPGDDMAGGARGHGSLVEDGLQDVLDRAAVGA